MLATKSSTTSAIPSRPPRRWYSDGGCSPIVAQAARFKATNSASTPHPTRCLLLMASALLTQPAFTPFVVLDVPVGLPGPDLGEPKIELLDIRVLPERFRRAVEHDPPVLHHIAVVGDGQRERGVLLHQEHGELLLRSEEHT